MVTSVPESQRFDQLTVRDPQDNVVAVYPPTQLHQRGHHVQHAHGRWAHFGAEGDHLSGGMIALIPTTADAKRLAIKGGEKAADLHCTLYFLGDDGDAISESDRETMTEVLRTYAAELEPIKAKIFGVAHWNANGDHPSWVWSVGDLPGTTFGLAKVHAMAAVAAENATEMELPVQHSPWAAHVCAAYTDDLSLAKELEKRLGEITFDRIRLSFGSSDVDIPLTEGVTAAGTLRREPKIHEDGIDFAAIQQAWQTSVDDVLGSLNESTDGWRERIASQVRDIVDSEDLSKLARIRLDTGVVAGMLHQQMLALAEESGKETQREAEEQGIDVPKWTLVGRKDRLLRRTADSMASIMGDSMILSARRRALASAGSGRSGEEVAAEVLAHLNGLSDSVQREAVGASLTAAQNAGRRAVLEATPPARYFASEILDGDTCKACRKIDGDEFTDLDAAYKAYPTGGYRKCLGMLRCRGMVVARWNLAETASAVELHGNKGDPGYDVLHPGRGSKGRKVESEGRDPMSYYRRDADSDDLSDDEIDQIEDDETLFMNYSSDGWSDPMAGFLRNGDSDPDEVFEDEELESMRDAMDRIADRHTLAEPVSVYRVAPGDLYDRPEGDRVIDPAFMSTTVHQNVTDTYRTSEDDVVIRIDMPEGAHVIPHSRMNPYASAPGEVILPRDMPLQVVGREDDVIIYEPVMGDEDAEQVEEDPTTGVMDDAAGEDTLYTDEERTEALNAYTFNGYRDMNAMLRNGADPQRGERNEVRRQIDILEEMIDIQEPTTSPMRVFRGSNQTLNLSEGQEFTDEGFVSTSTYEDLSRDFAEEGSMFTINVPAGSKILNVAETGGTAPEEEEFILPPGSRFRVTGVTPGPPTEYELEVVSD